MRRVLYNRCYMPKDNLQWKVSDAKRLLHAAQKAGFANRRMSLSKRPDGTLTIEVAAPSPVEVSDVMMRVRLAAMSASDTTYSASV